MTSSQSAPAYSDGFSKSGHQGTSGPASFRIVLISFLAAAIGIVAGFVAFALYKLIGLFTNLFFFHRWSADFTSVRFHPLGAWVILVPVVGGLIVGLMAKYGTPKIKGHGIPEAMEAVLVNRSRIAPRVAILKPISAAIAIGTGGPFGAEGPIIQTGGAIGSLVGQLLHTTAVERKVLLACGAAAGMSATFNTPIAGVILAIELLLFEFKSRSFIPLVIASTLATAVHMQLLGPGPMFRVSAMDFGIPRALPFYLLLGLICGLAAVGFSKLLYWIEDQFEKLPFDDMWWPAIGALGLGVIGFFVPRVFGVGYDTISDILNGQLAWKLLLIVMVAKAAALVISLGSGTSGGLLAPTFMWSAAMGGIFALVGNHFFPGAHLSPGAFALVAMGAVFGAASRATFSFIIFAFEITRDYNSVLPLMLVSVIADGIAMLFMPNSSIMTEKLARRGLRVHQDYEADALAQATVGDTMETDLPIVAASATVAAVAEGIARRDSTLTRHQSLLIVDDSGKLVGIITRGDILRALDKEPSGPMSVQEAGHTHLVVTYPDELVSEAAAKMLRFDIGRLPVVDRNDERKLVGYLGRAGILSARFRRLHDEHVREEGWLSGFSRPESGPASTSDQ
ncbi:MAG TPA: chloride channel protein [Candidatus Sulfotelmatobacter sp.]|nr:chloride channel protein [Candidatus Sulfotelmatobacter sp.]